MCRVSRILILLVFLPYQAFALKDLKYQIPTPQRTCAEDLQKPKLKPNKYDRVQWSTVDFELVFNELIERGIPPVANAIKNQYSDDLSEIFVKLYGRAVTGNSFVTAVQKYFGKWNDALERFGVDPKHRVEKDTFYQQIRLGLVDLKPFFRKILEKGLFLNVQAIRVTMERESMAVAKEIWGVDVKGNAFVESIRKSYGSWDNALMFYGYDPIVHRLRLSPKQLGKFSRGSVLAISPHQCEWVKHANGRFEYQAQLGEVIPTPEEALEQKETDDFLKTAIGRLKNGKCELTLALMEYLGEHSNLDDHDEVVSYLSGHLNQRIFWPDVESVLADLAKNLSTLARFTPSQPASHIGE
jgi:hypothetical protein